MMPNMDGFTLAEEIRDINPDVPIFFLSQNHEGRYHSGYKLGADDYITKPFDSEVLLLKNWPSSKEMKKCIRKRPMQNMIWEVIILTPPARAERERQGSNLVA